MLLETPKKVRLNTGSELTAVAEFNNGHSYIVVDDGCWVIVNDGSFSAWIVAEAVADLKLLPNSPKNYGPLKKVDA